jgi:hypothetical protein
MKRAILAFEVERCVAWLVWFRCHHIVGYCWRAVIAGNESNLNHGWDIANKKGKNFETFFIKYYWQAIKSLKTRYFTQSQAKNKSQGQGKLSSPRETKPLGNQASERLELPVKWRKEAKQGRKKKQRDIEWAIRISIHLLERNNQRAWDMIEAWWFGLDLFGRWLETNLYALLPTAVF